VRARKAAKRGDSVEIGDSILSALDADQRAVAIATRGPVCVIAGAGTGKTRAITHRIAYAAAIGTMDPQKVLALTFTAKAAGEMRARLRTLGVPTVAARTIHSAALKQLLYFWPSVFVQLIVNSCAISHLRLNGRKFLK
jgi:DNA helicase-2/ATP-dependent DNA helicase PcrA